MMPHPGPGGLFWRGWRLQVLRAEMEAQAQAARVTPGLTRRQQELGYVNDLTLLSAEQAYQQAMVGLVQAQATRFGDTAALYQALGGGWWNAKDTQLSESAPTAAHALD